MSQPDGCLLDLEGATGRVEGLPDATRATRRIGGVISEAGTVRADDIEALARMWRRGDAPLWRRPSLDPPAVWRMGGSPDDVEANRAVAEVVRFGGLSPADAREVLASPALAAACRETRDGGPWQGAGDSLRAQRGDATAAAEAGPAAVADTMARASERALGSATEQAEG